MARYGGEEFAVILPNTQLDELHAIAARIIRNVKFFNFPHRASDYHGKLTVSIGMASMELNPPRHNPAPRSKESALSLVQQADRALYQAKASGRNCAKL